MARARRGKGDSMILVGILFGAIVGGAIGLVYTPATGEENRKRLTEWIAHRTGEAQSKVKDALPGA